MIAVLPERPLSILSLVERLSRASGGQLKAPGNGVSTFLVMDEEMDVIGSDHIVEDDEAITLPGLEEPSKPVETVLAVFQQEISVVTTMGDVPSVAWHIITVGSWHGAGLIHDAAGVFGCI
ncbi:MAG: hypothetical protein MUF52_10160 [Syntrophobacteraceae bacterium]|nr:hypothetical protein [Syntrophobacteraceae bacterium]